MIQANLPPGNPARFTTILPLVLVLLLTGAILAVVQLGSVEAFWTTTYGVVLGLKLLAVLVLLSLAALNRLLFTPALARGDRHSEHWFARSIAAEVALVLVILGLSASWRFTPPPRVSTGVPVAPPTTVHLHTGQGAAMVTLDPGGVGTTTVRLVLLSPGGTPLEPKEVTFSLSNKAAGIESLEHRARRVGPGEWQVEGLPLPVSGQWRVRVNALVSDFDKVMLEGFIEVRP